jgi:hypothetical protein
LAAVYVDMSDQWAVAKRFGCRYWPGIWDLAASMTEESIPNRLKIGRPYGAGTTAAVANGLGQPVGSRPCREGKGGTFPKTAIQLYAVRFASLSLARTFQVVRCDAGNC